MLREWQPRCTDFLCSQQREQLRKHLGLWQSPCSSSSIESSTGLNAATCWSLWLVTSVSIYRWQQFLWLLWEVKCRTWFRVLVSIDSLLLLLHLCLLLKQQERSIGLLFAGELHNWPQDSHSNLSSSTQPRCVISLSLHHRDLSSSSNMPAGSLMTRVTAVQSRSVHPRDPASCKWSSMTFPNGMSTALSFASRWIKPTSFRPPACVSHVPHL